ncbi:MAG: hypothetical protein HN979_05895 [Actinobacteria bacterium]|jgi:hypothetical protein|nr:hypothetical protein [Actinomycetota bacterium]MBT3686824.1 hypothetical protein [Actinomycetota bacterium]MBT4037794.1 hypothetical protein [Actinomycetota bacterium]MBT4278406.1 hypothetical protein [Actinomycetota bacterium]MBT4343232.1 hypothetical protein [Actinomycetota bacterium]|tara:strand:+ start:432 stop:812 length:381 start_codon:yes stop_codon:yes gene_type:complete
MGVGNGDDRNSRFPQGATLRLEDLDGSDAHRLLASLRIAAGHERHLTHFSIAPIDTVAVAHVVGQLGTIFTQSDVITRLSGTPKDAADEVMGGTPGRAPCQSRRSHIDECLQPARPVPASPEVAHR